MDELTAVCSAFVPSGFGNNASVASSQAYLNLPSSALPAACNPAMRFPGENAKPATTRLFAYLCRQVFAVFTAVDAPR